MTIIKIGPFNFKVVEIERSDDWGYYDPVKLEIAVQSDCQKYVRGRTLIHEIMHAIWDVWVVKKGDSEERIVSAMSTGLAAFVRDNPEFWQSIVSDLK